MYNQSLCSPVQDPTNDSNPAKFAHEASLGLFRHAKQPDQTQWGKATEFMKAPLNLLLLQYDIT